MRRMVLMSEDSSEVPLSQRFRELAKKPSGETGLPINPENLKKERDTSINISKGIIAEHMGLTTGEIEELLSGTRRGEGLTDDQLNELILELNSNIVVPE